MAHSASLLNAKSEFDTFLFAPVGEDKKGTIVSVLSALARLDFDPWAQAADFARLPKETAKTRLAAMIATLPGMSPTSLEPGTVAARLIALLPAHPTRPMGLAQAVGASRSDWLGTIHATSLRSPRSMVLNVLVFAVWLIFQVIVMTQEPPQPSGSHPAKIADTTAPQVQPGPTSAVVQPGIGAAPFRKPLFGK